MLSKILVNRCTAKFLCESRPMLTSMKLRDITLDVCKDVISHAQVERLIRQLRCGHYLFIPQYFLKQLNTIPK